MTSDAITRAQRLANQTEPLRAAELRFIREFVGLRRTQIAGVLECDEAQIAAWEAGGDDPGEYAPALHRLLLERLERGPLARGPGTECVYVCSDESRPAGCRQRLDGSEEHIVPVALGGRLADPRVDCSGCNNALGSGAHRDLSSALHFFLVFAGAPTGRDENQAPMLVKEADGTPVLLTHGAVPAMPKSTVVRSERPDGQRDFQIRASDPASFAHTLATITQKTPDHPARRDLSVVHRIRRPQIGANFALGGGTHWAGVASLALNMLAYRLGTAAMKMPCLDAIKRFVHAPDDEASYVRWACGLNLGLPPQLDKLVGRAMSTAIAVSASSRSGLVIGRLLLLGDFQLEILLATGWTGPAVGIGYGIDPNDRREFGPLEFEPWDAAITSAEHRLPDVPAVSAAMTRVWGRAYRMGWARHFRELAERSAAHAVSEILEGLSEGTVLDEPLIARLVQAVVEIYGAGAFGIGVERTVQFSDLMRGLSAADAAVRAGGNAVERSCSRKHVHCALVGTSRRGSCR